MPGPLMIDDSENLESLHDGKYYDRTDPKFDLKKFNKKPDIKTLKSCKFCGKHFQEKGLWSHQARCPENPNRRTGNKSYKKTAAKKKIQEKKSLKKSILEQLKTLDPKLIELMNGEKLKQLIINEIKGGK